MRLLFRRMAVWAAALFCLAVAASAEGAKTPPKTGFLFPSLKHGARSYPYAVYVPADYSAGKAWPLIVFLHGAMESGSDGRKQVDVGLGSAIKANPDEWPFIVIFPQKPELIDAWETHDGAIQAMLARTRKDYRVDGERLYLTGLSQGGHGTWVLGARHAKIWAAIAPICGYGGLPLSDPNQRLPAFPDTVEGQVRKALIGASWPDGRKVFPATIKQLATALKATPVWTFHGDKDRTVPLEETQALVDAVKAAGGKPRLTVYPGVDHNSWDNAYRKEGLAKWLLSHRRKSAG